MPGWQGISPKLAFYFVAWNKSVDSLKKCFSFSSHPRDNRIHFFHFPLSCGNHSYSPLSLSVLSQLLIFLRWTVGIYEWKRRMFQGETEKTNPVRWLRWYLLGKFPAEGIRKDEKEKKNKQKFEETSMSPSRSSAASTASMRRCIGRLCATLSGKTTTLTTTKKNLMMILFVLYASHTGKVQPWSKGFYRNLILFYKKIFF